MKLKGTILNVQRPKEIESEKTYEMLSGIISGIQNHFSDPKKVNCTDIKSTSADTRLNKIKLELLKVFYGTSEISTAKGHPYSFVTKYYFIQHTTALSFLSTVWKAMIRSSGNQSMEGNVVGEAQLNKEGKYAAVTYIFGELRLNFNGIQRMIHEVKSWPSTIYCRVSKKIFIATPVNSLIKLSNT
jgi:hypothetical protein